MEIPYEMEPCNVLNNQPVYGIDCKVSLQRLSQSDLHLHDDAITCLTEECQDSSIPGIFSDDIAESESPHPFFEVKSEAESLDNLIVNHMEAIISEELFNSAEYSEDKDLYSVLYDLKPCSVRLERLLWKPDIQKLISLDSCLQAINGDNKAQLVISLRRIETEKLVYSEIPSNKENEFPLTGSTLAQMDGSFDSSDGDVCVTTVHKKQSKRPDRCNQSIKCEANDQSAVEDNSPMSPAEHVADEATQTVGDAMFDVADTIASEETTYVADIPTTVHAISHRSDEGTDRVYADSIQSNKLPQNTLSTNYSPVKTDLKKSRKLEKPKSCSYVNVKSLAVSSEVSAAELSANLGNSNLSMRSSKSLQEVKKKKNVTGTASNRSMPNSDSTVRPQTTKNLAVEIGDPNDLSLNIVLADTSSSDSNATDRDSAGEINLNRNRNLRRKKKWLSKEQRERRRLQLIEERKATLACMSTPRSFVLHQLIQEEMQKKRAELILPKNLPVYIPTTENRRHCIFPADLKLSQSDIYKIISDIFEGSTSNKDYNQTYAAIFTEMCEIQSKGLMDDSQLLYQLCMFISMSENDQMILYNLLQKVVQYSHIADMCCPLPSCNSTKFENWSQVGTHVLSHLPPIYISLMAESFRCSICWVGFPTCYHHAHHHMTVHTGEHVRPPFLIGFPSRHLNSLWQTPFFAKMFTDWTTEMMSSTRVSVEDYSHILRPSEASTALSEDVICEEISDGQSTALYSAEAFLADTIYFSESERTDDVRSHGMLLEENGNSCASQVTLDTSILTCSMDAEDAVEDAAAFLCWYCARPYIGYSAFYIHLLQEVMALPAGGILGGCNFLDARGLHSCHLCFDKVNPLLMEDHIMEQHAIEQISGLHTTAYAKSDMFCPYLGCHEKFLDYSGIGDHILSVHLPVDLKAKVRHQCMECKLVFPTIYHTQQHWEEDAEGKCSESVLCSSPDGFHVFEGHSRNQSNWTNDITCHHDVQLTKYKSFRFCSLYKSSSHVLCLICQKVFSQEADGLTSEKLHKSVKRLQCALAEHLQVNHHFTIWTPSEDSTSLHSELDRPLEPSLEIHTDESLNNHIHKKERWQPIPPVLSSKISTKKSRRSCVVSKAMSDTHSSDPMCSIHQFKMTFLSGSYHCIKCHRSKIWSDHFNRHSQYVEKTMSCVSHGQCVFKSHKQTKSLSYCTQCAVIEIHIPRNTSRYFCYKHGPRDSVTRLPGTRRNLCRLCFKPCKCITAVGTSLSDFVTVDSGNSSLVATNSVKSEIKKVTVTPVCIKKSSMSKNVSSSIVISKKETSELPTTSVLHQRNSTKYAVAADPVLRCVIHPDCKIQLAKRALFCSKCYHISRSVIDSPDAVYKGKPCEVHPNSTIRYFSNGQGFCEDCSSRTQMKGRAAFDLCLTHGLIKSNLRHWLIACNRCDNQLMSATGQPLDISEVKTINVKRLCSVHGLSFKCNFISMCPLCKTPLKNNSSHDFLLPGSPNAPALSLTSELKEYVIGDADNVINNPPIIPTPKAVSYGKTVSRSSRSANIRNSAESPAVMNSSPAVSVPTTESLRFPTATPAVLYGSPAVSVLPSESLRPPTATPADEDSLPVVDVKSLQAADARNSPIATPRIRVQQLWCAVDCVVANGEQISFQYVSDQTTPLIEYSKDAIFRERGRRWAQVSAVGEVGSKAKEACSKICQPSIFSCSSCSYVADNEQSLRCHRRANHNTPLTFKTKCGLCTFIFTDDIGPKEHYDMVHPEEKELNIVVCLVPCSLLTPALAAKPRQFAKKSITRPGSGSLKHGFSDVTKPRSVTTSSIVAHTICSSVTKPCSYLGNSQHTPTNASAELNGQVTGPAVTSAASTSAVKFLSVAELFQARLEQTSQNNGSLVSSNLHCHRSNELNTTQNDLNDYSRNNTKEPDQGNFEYCGFDHMNENRDNKEVLIHEKLKEPELNKHPNADSVADKVSCDSHSDMVPLPECGNFNANNNEDGSIFNVHSSSTMAPYADSNPEVVTYEVCKSSDSLTLLQVNPSTESKELSVEDQGTSNFNTEPHSTRERKKRRARRSKVKERKSRKSNDIDKVLPENQKDSNCIDGGESQSVENIPTQSADEKMVELPGYEAISETIGKSMDAGSSSTNEEITSSLAIGNIVDDETPKENPVASGVIRDTEKPITDEKSCDVPSSKSETSKDNTCTVVEVQSISTALQQDPLNEEKTGPNVSDKPDLCSLYTNIVPVLDQVEGSNGDTSKPNTAFTKTYTKRHKRSLDSSPEKGAPVGSKLDVTSSAQSLSNLITVERDRKVKKLGWFEDTSDLEVDGRKRTKYLLPKLTVGNEVELELRCRFCAKRLKTLDEVVDHIQNHRLYQHIVNCFICTKRFKRESKLKAHILDYHLEMPRKSGKTTSSTSGSDDQKTAPLTSVNEKRKVPDASLVSGPSTDSLTDASAFVAVDKDNFASSSTLDSQRPETLSSSPSSSSLTMLTMDGESSRSQPSLCDNFSLPPSSNQPPSSSKSLLEQDVVADKGVIKTDSHLESIHFTEVDREVSSPQDFVSHGEKPSVIEHDKIADKLTEYDHVEEVFSERNEDSHNQQCVITCWSDDDSKWRIDRSRSMRDRLRLVDLRGYQQEPCNTYKSCAQDDMQLKRHSLDFNLTENRIFSSESNRIVGVDSDPLHLHSSCVQRLQPPISPQHSMPNLRSMDRSIALSNQESGKRKAQTFEISQRTSRVKRLKLTHRVENSPDVPEISGIDHRLTPMVEAPFDSKYADKRRALASKRLYNNSLKGEGNPNTQESAEKNQPKLSNTLNELINDTSSGLSIPSPTDIMTLPKETGNEESPSQSFQTTHIEDEKNDVPPDVETGTLCGTKKTSVVPEVKENQTESTIKAAVIVRKGTQFSSRSSRYSKIIRKSKRKHVPTERILQSYAYGAKARHRFLFPRTFTRSKSSKFVETVIARERRKLYHSKRACITKNRKSRVKLLKSKEKQKTGKLCLQVMDSSTHAHTENGESKEIVMKHLKVIL